MLNLNLVLSRQVIFDAMSFVNVVHQKVAGGQEARTRFLADGGSGGGSVFAAGSVTQTSTTTLINEPNSTRPVEAPSPEPEPAATPAKCTSLYYVDENGAR